MKFRLPSSVVKFINGKRIDGGKIYSSEELKIKPEQVIQFNNVEIIKDKPKTIIKFSETGLQPILKVKLVITEQYLKDKKKELGWTKFKEWVLEEFNTTDRSFKQLCKKIMEKVNN